MKYLSRRQFMKLSTGTINAINVAHLMLSLNLLQEVQP